MSTPDALAFVYNADSGLFNTLTDIAHKVFSPQTYDCQLCALTHSPLGMRKQWRDFLDGLDLPLEFFHRDELAGLDLADGIALPTILARVGDRYEVLVESSRIDAADSLDALRELVISALARRGTD